MSGNQSVCRLESTDDRYDFDGPAERGNVRKRKPPRSWTETARKNKFRFAIDTGSAHIDEDDDHKADADPSRVIPAVSHPEVDQDGSGAQFRG